MANCDGCKRQGKLSESLKWQGDVKHFCNLLCILMFCKQQRTSDLPASNNTGKTGCGQHYLLMCVIMIGMFLWKLHLVIFYSPLLGCLSTVIEWAQFKICLLLQAVSNFHRYEMMLLTKQTYILILGIKISTYFSSAFLKKEAHFNRLKCTDICWRHDKYSASCTW